MPFDSALLLLLLDYFELLMAYDYTTGYIMDEILQELYSQIRVVLPDFVFKAKFHFALRYRELLEVKFTECQNELFECEKLSKLYIKGVGTVIK